MSTEQYTIMAIHAHPDDEVVFTGGTLLIYHRRGVRTVLITATGGEEGEIRDPDLDPEAARPRLREIRLEELRRGAAILEVDHLELLGYRDSGMAGSEANANPDNFHNADLEEVTRRVVELVRRYRPHVLLTYDEDGAYGHPDHIKCNKVTHRAYDLAGDAAYAPELGKPWAPLKLYYCGWNEEGWLKAREMYKERGLEWPWNWDDEERQDPDPEHQSIEEAVAEEVEHAAEAAASPEKEAQPPKYVPPPITTRIDVREVLDEKMRSTKQHRTQFEHDGLFMTMPEDILPYAMGWEHYSLVASRLAADEESDDLLAGLEQAVAEGLGR